MMPSHSFAQFVELISPSLVSILGYLLSASLSRPFVISTKLLVFRMREGRDSFLDPGPWWSRGKLGNWSFDSSQLLAPNQMCNSYLLCLEGIQQIIVKWKNELKSLLSQCSVSECQSARERRPAEKYLLLTRLWALNTQLNWILGGGWQSVLSDFL